MHVTPLHERSCLAMLGLVDRRIPNDPKKQHINQRPMIGRATSRRLASNQAQNRPPPCRTRFTFLLPVLTGI